MIALKRESFSDHLNLANVLPIFKKKCLLAGTGQLFG